MKPLQTAEVFLFKSNSKNIISKWTQ